ncbi:PaaI family thioesterase [Paralcaligenes sp. KSB-10]|jgi:uncharacterized protein (TIGR00369 family)|uniref:PaaI family thioesterase n=1 Tax=Paralcaligenes sp. KSB-10 TaxID=2901142 RepID=UPI001E2A1973|nr:PaaI family thioesterase [Paralcaligenes sp. KSB-10]UHL63373.1 PaaI family thioesterase [Paralcaligenes sp. KSB-10]
MSSPAFKPAHAQYAARVRESFARQRVMVTIGAELLSVSAGHVEIGLPYNAELTQQNGFIHAGITTTIADSAGGYAALSLFQDNEDVLTTELKLNLLAPADGERFVATGKVIKSGRTLTVCQVEVHACKGERTTLCAFGILSTMRLQSKPA